MKNNIVNINDAQSKKEISEYERLLDEIQECHNFADSIIADFMVKLDAFGVSSSFVNNPTQLTKMSLINLVLKSLIVQEKTGTEVEGNAQLDRVINSLMNIRETSVADSEIQQNYKVPPELEPK